MQINQDLIREVESYCVMELQACEEPEEIKGRDRSEAYKLYRGKELGKARKGRAQVVASDVMDAVEGILPDLLEVFSVDEPVSIKPRTIKAAGAAKANRDLLKYQLQRQLPWFVFLYTWIKDGLMYRNGFARWGWEYLYRWAKNEYATISAEDLDEIEWDEGEVLEGEPILDANGEILGLRNAVVKEKEILRDQPALEVIEPGNFLISPGAETIKDATFVAVRDFPSIDRLRREGEVYGYWDTDEIPMSAVANPEEIAAKYMENDRLDPLVELGNDDELRGRVERYTCYILWPETEEEGKKGNLKPMIATLLGKKIIGLTDNIFEDAPLITWSPILDTHRFEGISIVDLVSEFQRIKTALWRAVIDFISYQTAPQTVYERDSGVDLNALLAARPHSAIAVDSGKSNTVKPLERPPLGADVWRFAEWIEGMKEQRVGVTRLNQGLDSETLNKTARGMMSLMQAAQKRIRLIARLFAETALKPLFRKMIWANQNFVDRELVISIGENEDVTISPEMLGGNLDLVVNVGLGNSDNAVTIQQMEQLLKVLGELQGTPAGQAMVTPQNIYQVLKHIIEAMGRPASLFVTDPDKVMGGASERPSTPGSMGPSTQLPGTDQVGLPGGHAVGLPGVAGGGGAIPPAIAEQLNSAIQAVAA